MEFENLLLQKSKMKNKSNKKKFIFSPGGRKQDQEDPGLQDSRENSIPVNLKKRKKQRKKW
jgi:hypothetical protein